MVSNDEMVAKARSLVGVGMTTDPARYRELVAAGESASMAAEMCKMSGCALAIRGMWRELELDDPRVRPPYKAGMAIAWIVGIARARNAWQPLGRSVAQMVWPEPGDVVLVGGRDAGGPEHVYVVDVVDQKTGRLTTIDGGQRDATGRQVIQRKTRRWVVLGGRVTDQATASGVVRTVQGFVRCSALAVKP